MSVLTQRLVKEIESASEPVQAEVLDFVLFVKGRHDASLGERIQRTAGVCGGEACLGNTRIAIWMLETARRSGVSEAELLLDYPGLNRADLSAAWDYVMSHSTEIENLIRQNEEA
ncbi:uncharacterized protein (DUF433 family) [Prosthecobacter fusiformis]|uniref:Uncharacterized protein (DUF433 family) n=1 Tax=Prosthecobacter fusiformis TaxID=48464 RepID=A0A4R7RZC5_9BACT|nr:DUF433 domain-containing protein [Prosthecobacter fusiformis]TDU70759.1 uncharacterized protein (DUF433 family) [Prosthecobacter fusiformis]